MERFSPPAASLKKRISPPIAWNLGLASKDPKIIRVILLGHQGVGKTGKNPVTKAFTLEIHLEMHLSPISLPISQERNVLNFLTTIGPKSRFLFRCTTRATVCEPRVYINIDNIVSHGSAIRDETIHRGVRLHHREDLQGR